MIRTKNKYARYNLAKKMCLGKIKHKSMLSAQYVFDAMSNRNNNNLEIYKCPFCHNYHIGHNNYKDEDSKNKRLESPKDISI